MARISVLALLLSVLSCCALASLPPLVCPAGGPIGSVDLRVVPARGGEALPLRTINRIEEGDSILYKPLLRSGEERKGDVALVLVPANKTAAGEKILILDPKEAREPQQWKAPWRVAVVGFVYGPTGLKAGKVRDFLTRDDELVAQLADYAEKTAQAEALIAALSTPSSPAVVQSALQGFSSQYGLNVQIDRSASAEQQAMVLFRALNPAIASYDPITPQGSRQASDTASLATSVATLFFGSPVGLAAGGTAMLLNLKSMAFPRSEFRSSLAQTLPGDGLGLCGRRDPAPPHTKLAYLWASRVPNIAPPSLAVERANSLPAGVSSPLPVAIADADWKFVERARNWRLQDSGGHSVPIAVQKLGDTKTLELNLASVKPGTYALAASWDWDPLPVKGRVEVRPLGDLAKARPLPASQDLLVARTGKVPVTVEGADFQFVTKVEIERRNDKFATPAPVPFVLPRGLRQGPQQSLDVQVNTADLDPGEYALRFTQLDGKVQSATIKILPAPPVVANLPVVMNQGAASAEVVLKGERLDLLKKMESPGATLSLGPPAGSGERELRIRMSPAVAAGTSFAIKAYIRDRVEPMTLADAIHIVGPRPNIVEARVSQPPEQSVQLGSGELAGGFFLSAILRIQHMQSNTAVTLGCAAPGGAVRTLKLGERAGAWSLQQISPDQAFVSFDTGVWPNGCVLQATALNAAEGESDRFTVGRVVRVPRIDKIDLTPGDPATGAESRATVVGENLETIEKAGWSPDAPEPVVSLPLPAAGDGSKQTLQIRLDPPADPTAVLNVWLRGEDAPRQTRVHL